MGKRIYTLLNKLVMILSFDNLRKKSVGIILILRLVSGRGTNFSQICMSEKKNLLGTIQHSRCLEIDYQQQFLQSIKKEASQLKYGKSLESCSQQKCSLPVMWLPVPPSFCPSSSLMWRRGEQWEMMAWWSLDVFLLLCIISCIR